MLVASEQRHPGHLRNNFADGTAEGSNGHIFIRNHLFQRNAVGILEGSLQDWLGDLESDEVVIAVGGVAIFGHLHHVETEFGANVSFGIVLVRNLVAVFCAQIGKQKANGLVHRGMSHIVGRVVSESAESEGVFIQVTGFVNEVDDEIPAAHIVREIAEVFVAEGVVAHVLHQAAPVSEGVRLL